MPLFAEVASFPIAPSTLYPDVGSLGQGVGLDLQDLAYAEAAGYDPRPFISYAAADTSDLLASGNFAPLFAPLFPPFPTYSEIASIYATTPPATLQSYGIGIENYFTPPAPPLGGVFVSLFG